MRTTIKKAAAITAIAILSACSSEEEIAQPTERPIDVVLDHMVPARLSESQFSGVVLVSKNDLVLYEGAFTDARLTDDAPITPDDQFALASLTKPFTALLVLQLVEEGLLSLDDTIADHLPAYSASYSDQVTVRQLLQNRSGIPHTADIPGWFDNDFKQSQTPDVFLETIASLPLRFEPGADYLYSNNGYYLLGLIIEAVTGSTYADALAERVLARLGMSDTGQIYEDGALDGLVKNYLQEDDGSLTQVPLTNPRLFQAAASLFSTADDLHAWSEALMAGGLLSEESQAIMFDTEEPMGWVTGNDVFQDGSNVPFRFYNGELAGYGSMLTQLPDSDHTIIILSNNGTSYNALVTLTLDIAGALTED